MKHYQDMYNRLSCVLTGATVRTVNRLTGNMDWKVSLPTANYEISTVPIKFEPNKKICFQILHTIRSSPCSQHNSMLTVR